MGNSVNMSYESDNLEYFKRNLSSYVKVKVPVEVASTLRNIAQQMANLKKVEYTNFRDTYGISYRWYIGLIGEWGVTEVLNRWGLTNQKFNTYYQDGSSNSYNHADFLELGFTLGCKAAIMGRCVKVKLNPHCGEVVCVYDKAISTLYICGILTGEIARKYGSFDLIEDEELRTIAKARGTKVGFNRYDKLIPFTKNNVLNYANKLMVDYKTSLSKKEYDRLSYCTYVERDRDKIVFKTLKNGNLTTKTLKLPFEANSDAEIASVLEGFHTYISLEGKHIFKGLQEAYHGKPLLVHVVCALDCIRQMGIPYISEWDEPSSIPTTLMLLFQPVFPKGVKFDAIGGNFYVVMWVLNLYVNTRNTNAVSNVS